MYIGHDFSWIDTWCQIKDIRICGFVALGLPFDHLILDVTLSIVTQVAARPTHISQMRGLDSVLLVPMTLLCNGYTIFQSWLELPRHAGSTIPQERSRQQSQYGYQTIRAIGCAGSNPSPSRFRSSLSNAGYVQLGIGKFQPGWLGKCISRLSWDDL